MSDYDFLEIYQISWVVILFLFPLYSFFWFKRDKLGPKARPSWFSPMLYLLLITYGLLGSTSGMVRGNPGDLYLVTAVIALPLLTCLYRDHRKYKKYKAEKRGTSFPEGGQYE